MYWKVIECHIQGVQKAGQIYLLAPPCGLHMGHKIADFMVLAFISFIIAFRGLSVLRGDRKPYEPSLYSWSDLPLAPSYQSHWGHKETINK